MSEPYHPNICGSPAYRPERGEPDGDDVRKLRQADEDERREEEQRRALNEHTPLPWTQVECEHCGDRHPADVCCCGRQGCPGPQECYECSVAGGADRAVYHCPPACKAEADHAAS